MAMIEFYKPFRLIFGPIWQIGFIEEWHGNYHFKYFRFWRLLFMYSMAYED